jgi:phosphomannomutase
MDGVKFYFADECWLSIRFSGTEPILRIFMEAEDKADAEQFKQAVLRDAQLHLEVRNDV